MGSSIVTTDAPSYDPFLEGSTTYNTYPTNARFGYSDRLETPGGGGFYRGVGLFGGDDFRGPPLLA